MSSVIYNEPFDTNPITAAPARLTVRNGASGDYSIAASRLKVNVATVSALAVPGQVLRDSYQVEKIRTGPSLSLTGTLTSLLARWNTGNQVAIMVKPTGQALVISTIGSTGTETVRTTVNVPADYQTHDSLSHVGRLGSGVDYWITMLARGNVITGAIYDADPGSDPDAPAAVPFVTAVWNIPPTDTGWGSTSGSQQNGNAGLRSNGLNSNAQLGVDNYALVDPTAAVLPVNTASPAITGTVAVGQTLTCSQGTWSGSPTSFAFQWQESIGAGTASFVDIPGATAATFTPTNPDRVYRCVVTATNASGSASANSNSVTIPPAPANTALPVLTSDGTPASGETITGDSGAFSNATTFTIQMYRSQTGASWSPITGASIVGPAGTTLAYTIPVSDEGAHLRVGVIAHGAGGDSTETFSNEVVPAVTAPLSDASGLFYYSGGAGNTDPELSIGGARGGTIPAGQVASVFGPIPGSLAQTGGRLYAVLYVRNGHTLTTDPATRLFVADQPDHPEFSIAVAVPAEAAGQVVPALASRTTPPAGVTFEAPADFASGLDFGDLAPGATRGIYVELTIAPDAPSIPSAGDFFEIAVDSETV